MSSLVDQMAELSEAKEEKQYDVPTLRNMEAIAYWGEGRSGDKKFRRERMAAALEALKDPPAEFIAFLSRELYRRTVDDRVWSDLSEETQCLIKGDVQRALQATITQAINEGAS